MTDTDEDDFVDAEIVYTELSTDNLSKIQWRTKDKRLIYLKDMADSHLRNSALFLMDLGYKKCIAPENVRIIWLRVFSMEWQRRLLAKRNGLMVIVQ